MVQEIGLDALIREHPFFAGLDAPALEFIAGCAANERFNEGEFVVREGQPADKFYIIRHGAVALEVKAPGRDPIAFQSLEEGNVIGCSSIVPPFRWTADARAVRLTRLVSFDAVCFRTKMDSEPALGNVMYSRFLRVMAQRLEAARMQLIDFYGRPQ